MHMTHCSEASGLSVCVCNITARLALRTNARVVDATGTRPGNLGVSSQHTHTHTNERLTTHIAVGPSMV